MIRAAPFLYIGSSHRQRPRAPVETVATVTVMTGSLSRSATVTIEPAAVINVVGKVLDMVGGPLAAAQVLIEDVTGPRTPVLTTGTGNFTVNGVIAPHDVSVTAPGAAALLQQTWSGVTRLNPQIVMGLNSTGGLPAFCASGNGRINGTITPECWATRRASTTYRHPSPLRTSHQPLTRSPRARAATTSSSTSTPSPATTRPPASSSTWNGMVRERWSGPPRSITCTYRTTTTSLLR